MGKPKDYVSIVETKTKRFAIVVEDEDKAKEFFATYHNSMAELYDAVNKEFNRLLPEEGVMMASTHAVQNILKNGAIGIGFYVSNDKMHFVKLNWPPKNPNKNSVNKEIKKK